MKTARITLLTGALALVATLAAVQFADSAGAAGAKAATETAAGSAASQAIEAASAEVRASDGLAFTSPVLKDSLSDLLATARALTLDGQASGDDAEANRILDAAAWTLDIAIRRVDGEAGEREGAHLDDWLHNAQTKTRLYALLMQARSEVFRSKRD